MPAVRRRRSMSVVLAPLALLHAGHRGGTRLRPPCYIPLPRVAGQSKHILADPGSRQKASLRRLDDNQVFFHNFNPACFKILFNVPGARSSSYAAPELSSTPERVLWRPEKFRHYANDPHNHEGEKARQDVPHARNVRPILRMQIGLDGVVKRKNDDQENCAAKPRKIVVQECLRLRETLWREPVLLIR